MFLQRYNVVICKIYISLYDIRLSTKLANVFCYRQSRIFRNNVDKAKYLSFGKVKTLLLEILKEQLNIGAKLVKDRNVPAISIIMRLNLAR